MASISAFSARPRSSARAAATAFSARPRSSARTRSTRLRSLPMASISAFKSRSRRQRQRTASFMTTRPMNANPGAASHAPQTTSKIAAPVSAKPPKRNAEVGLASRFIANERMGRCLQARTRRLPSVEKPAFLASWRRAVPRTFAAASSVLQFIAVSVRVGTVFASDGFGSLSASEEWFASGVTCR